MALLLSLSPPWPMASKPAVRRVTDWNRALRAFSHTGMSPRVAGLWYSSRKKKAAPPTIRRPVMSSTILLYTDSLPQQRARRMSSQTKKPRPPMAISAAVVPSMMGLS